MIGAAIAMDVAPNRMTVRSTHSYVLAAAIE
jgi:hypothetical protein